MTTDNSNLIDSGYASQTRQRVKEKISDLAKLKKQRDLIDSQIERTEKYIEQLNNFLISEGQRPELIIEPRPSNVGGKTGNRSKKLPNRKIEWAGKSINEIIKSILNAHPDKIYHVDELSGLIYEIQSESDLNMVLKNLRSMLRTGSKAHLWDWVGRAKFKSNLNTQGK